MMLSPKGRHPGFWVPHAAALAWAGMVWSPVLAADTLPAITAVTLSSGGTAEIHRRATVSGNDTLRLTVPLAQVDDVLKSLLVRDTRGRVDGLTLDGLAPVEEAFATLPFGPDDLRALPRLVSALAGVAVRARSGGRMVEGTVLGVDEVPVHREGGVAMAQELTVQDAQGQLQVLRLGGDAELAVLDDAMRTQLQRAVAAHGQHRTESARVLSLGLSGQGERDVALSYVVPAPVWKAAYRLVAEGDQARLQAWAVLENASGENWDNVAITLTSGAPVTLTQRLHERYWRERPELPVAVGAAAPPRADTQAMRPARTERADSLQLSAARAYAPAVAAPAPAPMGRAKAADLAAASAPAQARDTQVDVRYTLPGTVTVPAGRTLSVPFVDAHLKAEQVSVFQPERGGSHPVAGIWLTNDTGASLPPGILTVYDGQGGHAGDGQLPALGAGEQRMVYFADDIKVDVQVDQQPTERITDVRIADGVLRARRVSRIETTYRVRSSADTPRAVIVEQPRRSGWTLTSDALDGDTATHHRLRVTVPAGGDTRVAAVSERAGLEELALIDADVDTLLRWSGGVPDAATATRLRDLASLRTELSRAQQAEQAARDDIAVAIADQERVRANLAAVPADSALAQRYLDMLAQQEDQLVALRTALDTSADQVRTLRSRYTAAIGN